jgi:hypothetical protein
MTATTTKTRPAWSEQVESFGSRSGAFLRKIPFATYFEGSVQSVEIRQFFGGGVLKRGHDYSNLWRNGEPGASVNLFHADADTIRAAAAALLQAADLMDQAEATR